MPKRNYRTYKIPIYFGEFTVICQSNYYDLHILLKALSINTMPKYFDPIQYGAFALSELKNNKLSRYFIFIKPDTKPGQIAHECLHVTTYLFSDRGMSDLNNDEPQAYILTWLVNKVHEFQQLCQKEIIKG
jgi:hypothetical protein